VRHVLPRRNAVRRGVRPRAAAEPAGDRRHAAIVSDGSDHCGRRGQARLRPMPNPRERLKQLDLVEAQVQLPARTLSVLRPRDAEALLDEEAFEHEEFLPHWAELWSSGEVLAREVADRDVAGFRVVELGCGLALPSLAAAMGGAYVLA